MVKEKRKVRGYKITDKPYNKALKRAKKENNPLASQIEEWVRSYGAGYGIEIFLPERKRVIVVDEKIKV